MSLVALQAGLMFAYVYCGACSHESRHHSELRSRAIPDGIECWWVGTPCQVDGCDCAGFVAP